MPSPRASDMMSKLIATLSPDTDIYTAIQTLLKKRISGAPVVDDRGGLVGMLSEKDCLKVLTAEAFEGLPEGKVADYMTSTVEVVLPSTHIWDIVHQLLNRRFRRLPVVDRDGRLVGLVTRRDVLAAIESMRDNPLLYGTQDHHLELEEEGWGVDSAMRRARGR
ncbi:MAG: CBS domain-containing protein [Acidobacteriota bacterium]